MVSMVNSIKYLITPNFSQMLPKGTLPNSIFEASMTLTLKPGKAFTRKGSYRPTYLMNMDAQILSKILAN